MCFAPLFLLSFAKLYSAEADVSDGSKTLTWRAPRLAPEHDLLARAARANANLYANLESFICQEQIERFKGESRQPVSRHIDSIKGQLSFENGLERFTDLKVKDQPLATMASLNGAWSEGEFGTLLKQTEQLLRTQKVVFDRWTRVAETIVDSDAALYHFDVSAEESPWDLEVSGHHYTIPFQTDVWIDRNSGEILKILRRSMGMPTELHINQITWGVTLSPVDLNGGKWLLPDSGTYEVAYSSSHRREWNVMRFSGYQRFGSEVAIRYQ